MFNYDRLFKAFFINCRSVVFWEFPFFIVSHLNIILFNSVRESRKTFDIPGVFLIQLQTLLLWDKCNKYEQITVGLKIKHALSFRCPQWPFLYAFKELIKRLRLRYPRLLVSIARPRCSQSRFCSRSRFEVSVSV
jgi:hypothetical protein